METIRVTLGVPELPHDDDRSRALEATSRPSEQGRPWTPANNEGKPDIMIAEGTSAPKFTLQDHFAREISLEDFHHRHHVLLLFYPLDGTPT